MFLRIFVISKLPSPQDIADKSLYPHPAGVAPLPTIITSRVAYLPHISM